MATDDATETTRHPGLAESAVRLAQRWITESAAVSPDPAGGRLADALRDPRGLDFTLAFVDSVVRPDSVFAAAAGLRRISADAPTTMPWYLRQAVRVGGALAPVLPMPVLPLSRRALRDLVGDLIVEASPKRLTAVLARQRETSAEPDVMILSAPALGDASTAARRAEIADVIARGDVDHVTVLVSSLIGSTSMWDAEGRADALAAALDALFALAAQQEVVTSITVEVDRHRDLDVAVTALQRVLDDPRFRGAPAGIAIPAALIDAPAAVARLTAWAQERVGADGAPIRLRLMSGAARAEERADALLHGWRAVTFDGVDGDAALLRLVDEVLRPERVDAVLVEVADHDAFRLAHAVTVASDRGVADALRLVLLPASSVGLAAAVSRDTGETIRVVPVANRLDRDVALTHLAYRLADDVVAQRIDLLEPEDALARGRERYLDAQRRASEPAPPVAPEQNRSEPAGADVDTRLTRTPTTGADGLTQEVIGIARAATATDTSPIATADALLFGGTPFVETAVFHEREGEPVATVGSRSIAEPDADPTSAATRAFAGDVMSRVAGEDDGDAITDDADVDVMSSGPDSDDAVTDDVNSDDANSDDANPDDANPDDANPDDADTDDANPDDADTDDANPDDANSDETNAGGAGDDARDIDVAREVSRDLATVRAAADSWAGIPAVERAHVLRVAAALLRERRADAVAGLMAAAGLVFADADAEVNETIDAALHTAVAARELDAVPGAIFEPIATTAIIAAGDASLAGSARAIFAALAAGSGAVLLGDGPASAVATILLAVLRDAGVPHDLIVATSGVEARFDALATDVDTDRVVIAGGDATIATRIASRRPDQDVRHTPDLLGASIVMPTADVDLAAAALVRSAFAHGGRARTSSSLAVLVGSIARSERFARQLADAARSFRLGSPADAGSDSGPLAIDLDAAAVTALTELGDGEQWLVEPEDLGGGVWRGGIRVGLTPESRFVGEVTRAPVLGILHADTLADAVAVVGAAGVRVAALHTQDPRDLDTWLADVDAGSLFVNRDTLATTPGRHPLVGWNGAASGAGFADGGPNHLIGLGSWRPSGGGSSSSLHLRGLDSRISSLIETAQPELDYASFEALRRGALADAVAWDREFGRVKDVTGLGIERNLVRYRRVAVALRATEEATLGDLLRVVIAGVRADSPMTLSSPKGLPGGVRRALGERDVTVFVESEEEWIGRMRHAAPARVRIVGDGSDRSRRRLLTAMGGPAGVAVFAGPVTTAGRIELLPFLREQAICITAHRFGHLDDWSAAVI